MSRAKRRKRHLPPPGSAPGTLCADPQAPLPVMDVLAFGPGEIVEKRLDSLDWIEQNKGRYPVLWINVDGLGDTRVVAELGRIFDLHKLALEDVVHVNQRPKVDDYANYLFITLRMLQRLDGAQLETEQLSMFLGKNYVLTFQEGVPGDCLEPVRNRLRLESSRLRAGSPDFLAYALVDAVVDAYFPLLEELGETLETLENAVLLNPSTRTMHQIHAIKRDLLVVRRAVWPLRDVLGPLYRDECTLVSPECRVFLRDCYDHCIQVIDLTETYRELGSSLMDIYLSSLSNKMNEVMKVLTIITTIFVPLTFVAGVYGMNFNPEKSPWNMPELNARYGYPACLLAMLLMAGLELYYFWRRGWLFQNENPLPPAEPPPLPPARSTPATEPAKDPDSCPA